MTDDNIQIKVKMPNLSQEYPASSKAPNQNLKDMDVLCTFKIKIEPKFSIWVYQRPLTRSKSIAGCQTPVRNLQRPPSPKSGLKGHGCSLHLQNQDREPKFGIWEYQRPVTISKSISGCRTPVRNLQHPSKPQISTERTSDHIQINICMQNTNQEPPVSSKAPNQNLKDMDVLCIF